MILPLSTIHISSASALSAARRWQQCHVRHEVRRGLAPSDRLGTTSHKSGASLRISSMFMRRIRANIYLHIVNRGQSVLLLSDEAHNTIAYTEGHCTVLPPNDVISYESRPILISLLLSGVRPIQQFFFSIMSLFGTDP